jgi:hypothetical protein
MIQDTAFGESEIVANSKSGSLPDLENVTITTEALQDQDRIEIESMYAAADKGGGYLDKIGQTDLAKLDHRQWMTFIETIIREFETTRTKMTVEIPF